MRKVKLAPLLAHARVAILHRPHPSVDKLENQLQKIGLQVEVHWPELDASAYGVDYIFFDVDMGFDAQFPWKRGDAPIPLIALIGSEAPGRVEWALQMGSDAHLLKPIGDHGVYSALLIAKSAFETRMALLAQARDLHERLSARQTIVQAVGALSSILPRETDAYDFLRKFAMSKRINIEKAAELVVSGELGPEPDLRGLYGRRNSD